MKITILSCGDIKEKYFIDAINEYKKRLSKYTDVILTKVKDEPIVDNPSQAEIDKVKRVEGERLIKAIPSNNYVIVLDLKGVMLSSEELAAKMSEIFTYNSANITFIIGGSLGLSKEDIDKANYRLCFSKMTFPHKLMQVILLEQIYRAFKINNNETYHK